MRSYRNQRLTNLTVELGWPQRIRSFAPHAWYAIVFIGVSSGVGYFLWLYALSSAILLEPFDIGMLGATGRAVAGVAGASQACSLSS